MKKLNKASSSVKQPQPVVPGAIVSEEFSSKSRLAVIKRKLIVVVLIAVVVIGGVGVYLFVNSPEPQKAALPDSVNTDYATTRIVDIPMLLEHDYGLTLNDLDKPNFEERLKSFEMAHDVGLVLHRTQKADKAVIAYRVADRFSNDKTPYNFFREFCGIAYRAKETQLGDAMCAKAKDRLAVSNLSEAEKAEIAASIDRGLKDIREGVE